MKSSAGETLRRKLPPRNDGNSLPLSKLPGRGLLMKRCDQLLRDGQQIAVVFIDLDGFKAVNDILGHRAGDRCLQRVAATLSRVPRGGVVFRYGGDEFAVLIQNCPRRRIPECAETIRKSIEMINPGGQLQVTASIGVVCSGSGQETTAKLLEDADDAAYASKILGKNRVTMCPLSDELRRKIHHRRAEETFAAKNRLILLKTRESSQAVGQLCYHVGMLYYEWSRLAEMDLRRTVLSDDEITLMNIESMIQRMSNRIEELRNELSSSVSDAAEIKIAISSLMESKEVNRQLADFRWKELELKKEKLKELKEARQKPLRRKAAELQMDYDTLEISTTAARIARHYVTHGVLKLIDEKYLVQLVNELDSFSRSSNGESDRLRQLRNGCQLLWKFVGRNYGDDPHDMTLADYMQSIHHAEKTSNEVSDLIAALLPEMRAV